MPVFNCFFKIISKNKSTIITYLGIFITLMIIFSQPVFSASDFNTDYSEQAIPIAVIDRDGGELSRSLAEYLGERHELIELRDELETMQDAIFYRQVMYILIIPEGFGESFERGEDSPALQNVKLPDSSSGIYADGQIERYLATVRAYLGADFALTEALAHTADDLRLGTQVEVYGESISETPEAYYYFQYLAYLFLSLIILSIGPILMAFNKSDLRRRMESSSLRLRERNTQIALGCVVFALGLWLVFMIGALVLYRGEMLTMASGLRVVNSLAFVVVCVSIAFMMGQFFRKSMTLSAATNGVTLGMSFLCGIFVPQELLGGGVVAASKFLPAYWYVRNNDMLAGSGSMDMASYGQGVLIQLAFAAAIFAVALVTSRQRQLRAES